MAPLVGAEQQLTAGRLNILQKQLEVRHRIDDTGRHRRISRARWGLAIGSLAASIAAVVVEGKERLLLLAISGSVLIFAACMSRLVRRRPTGAGLVRAERATGGFPAKLQIPTQAGRMALRELDRVPWDDLLHARGKGVSGAKIRSGENLLVCDVRTSLELLGSENPGSRAEAFALLFSNIYDGKGTIYQATAFAFPFVAALAASEQHGEEDMEDYRILLSGIGAAAASGAGASLLVCESIRSSAELLRTMAERHPGLALVERKLAALVRGDTPDPAAAASLQAMAEGEEGSSA